MVCVSEGEKKQESRLFFLVRNTVARRTTYIFVESALMEGTTLLAFNDTHDSAAESTKCCALSVDAHDEVVKPVSLASRRSTVFHEGSRDWNLFRMIAKKGEEIRTTVLSKVR